MALRKQRRKREQRGRRPVWREPLLQRSSNPCWAYFDHKPASQLAGKRRARIPSTLRRRRKNKNLTIALYFVCRCRTCKWVVRRHLRSITWKYTCVILLIKLSFAQMVGPGGMYVRSTTVIVPMYNKSTIYTYNTRLPTCIYTYHPTTYLGILRSSPTQCSLGSTPISVHVPKPACRYTGDSCIILSLVNLNPTELSVGMSLHLICREGGGIRKTRFHQVVRFHLSDLEVKLWSGLLYANYTYLLVSYR